MKIGITGGIGSGKSYVCKRLEARGYEVYDCDSAAKRLIRTSPEIKEKLTALIGPDTYSKVEGEYRLNKAAVAKFLLASEENAKAIDRIVHPAVFKDFEESGLQWMESAILYESGISRLVDKVIVVTAPEEVRIRRVMQRDGISQEIHMVQNPSIRLERKTSAGDVFVNGYFGRVTGATYAVQYYPYTSAAQYGTSGTYFRYYYNGQWVYGYFDSSGYGHPINSDPSLSGGEWVDAGTFTDGTRFQEYLYKDAQSYYHSASLWIDGGEQKISDIYNASTQSGTYGTILGTIRSLNSSIDRNFYTTYISVSSFNTSNDYYIANDTEVQYRIGDSRVKASTVYTGSGSWDNVTNFYKYLYYSGTTESFAAWSDPGSILITSQEEEYRNIIAPRFLVSSALNANSGLLFDTAVKRGATYQEAGYPAGRWRIPSEAEIAFIVARQRDGVIPALYATNTYYWAGSGRLVYVPASSSTPISFYSYEDACTLSGATTFSVRFVYDLWYWGDTASTTNVYHPNGHNTAY